MPTILETGTQNPFKREVLVLQLPFFGTQAALQKYLSSKEGRNILRSEFGTDRLDVAVHHGADALALAADTSWARRAASGYSSLPSNGCGTSQALARSDARSVAAIWQGPGTSGRPDNTDSYGQCSPCGPCAQPDMAYMRPSVMQRRVPILSTNCLDVRSPAWGEAALFDALEIIGTLHLLGGVVNKEAAITNATFAVGGTISLTLAPATDAIFYGFTATAKVPQDLTVFPATNFTVRAGSVWNGVPRPMAITTAPTILPLNMRGSEGSITVLPWFLQNMREPRFGGLLIGPANPLTVEWTGMPNNTELDLEAIVATSHGFPSLWGSLPV